MLLQCNSLCITGACTAVQMLLQLHFLSCQSFIMGKAGSLISCSSGLYFSCPYFMSIIFFLALLMCMFGLHRGEC